MGQESRYCFVTGFLRSGTTLVLGGVMALERGLIRAGVSLPCGGSLLAITHKR